MCQVERDELASWMETKMWEIYVERLRVRLGECSPRVHRSFPTTALPPNRRLYAPRGGRQQEGDRSAFMENRREGMDARRSP